jgi:hypothetical protein
MATISCARERRRATAPNDGIDEPALATSSAKPGTEPRSLEGRLDSDADRMKLDAPNAAWLSWRDGGG